MRALVALAVAALAACRHGEPGPCGGAGVICPVAGTGLQAFDGDGKPALQTSFYLPSAVRVGPDKLLYVMDFNNYRLRRVAADGTVETVVGNGVHAVAVAGAIATDLPLENPVSFAFAADGSVLLVALHDPRVLRVGKAGVIEVIAGAPDTAKGDDGDGGDALAAHFSELAGIAVGPDGAVYVSDDDPQVSRVRVIRNGTVTAFAGASGGGYSGDGGPAAAARLSRPSALAFDAEGRLYIADTGNHVVRRVAGGVIETVAGTGTAGASGDGGDPRHAALKLPRGIAVAPDGALLVADTGNNAIRRVDGGRIDRVAGTGAPGLAGDGGPAIAAELNAPAEIDATADGLYIADQLNNCVRLVGAR